MKRTLAMWIGAAAVGAAAQTPTPPPQPPTRVTVSAPRDPVDKSYRKMIAGMDRFERDHALAPQATLRFQLLPRLPSTRLDGITLRVVGDTTALPVAVAPDHTFTLPRDALALRQDAALLASSKTATLTWRAQVRSPDVPPGMRRLGDLRLECRVGVEAGLLSNNSRLFAWLGEVLTDPDRVCSAPDGNYLLFAERPLFSVTLRDGARIATLPLAALYAGGTQTPATLPFCDCQVLLDRSYYAPLWDRAWSDDTLLSFEDIDAPPGPLNAAVAPDHRSVEQMRARLGPAAQMIEFDSGYQVWRYAYPSAGKGLAEFVVLFGADGLARKARLSEAL
ncbi:hypothetical protein [Duganella aceris]|uniref:Uncharacterized protein n=1 Tax=Duganella aceris TaxID=2703883 RepID=A0ABX0FEH1_9BURK|nr:hypothetical protein [Duganella aceris]NGZ82776.1 hypothetical protein [Duganella aceris]